MKRTQFLHKEEKISSPIISAWPLAFQCLAQGTEVYFTQHKKVLLENVPCERYIIIYYVIVILLLGSGTGANFNYFIYCWVI